MRFTGLACTAVAVLWATGVAAATTWEDIKRESERHEQLMSEVYGPWSPEAFDGFDRVKECLANNTCARNPCKPIEKQLDWLGSYCRARVAQHEGNERVASREVRNAFRQLLKHYPSDDHIRANRNVSLAAEERDRQSSQQLALVHEVTGYTAWRFGQALLAQHARELEQLRLKAESGDPKAQFDFALKLYNDRSNNANKAESARWFRKAAEQGHAAAQNNLGVMYDTGEGVAKDDAQAVDWYRKAAEQGDARAQVNLGAMYANGQGVAKDDAQAVGWYRKAAEQGHAGAQLNLGNRYANGEGVAKDDAQAVGWYRKAAEQGHASAQANLGFMYYNGEGVAKDDAQAVGWYRKAAEQGHAAAQRSLGWFYAFGRGGLLQDNTEAAAWYSKAASQGDSHAQHNLALLYRDGVGVDRAPVTAYAWMNLSAAGGYENAPSERDQITAQLGATDLKKGQQLSREWKPGQLIPVVRAAAQPAQSAAASPRQASSPFPARPAKVPGRISCNTRCVNGDCYRTYDDGRQERFQAQRRMNAFGEWEWDSGSC